MLNTSPSTFLSTNHAFSSFPLPSIYQVCPVPSSTVLKLKKVKVSPLDCGAVVDDCDENASLPSSTSSSACPARASRCSLLDDIVASKTASIPACTFPAAASAKKKRGRKPKNFNGADANNERPAFNPYIEINRTGGERGAFAEIGAERVGDDVDGRVDAGERGDVCSQSQGRCSRGRGKRPALSGPGEAPSSTRPYRIGGRQQCYSQLFNPYSKVYGLCARLFATQ